MIVVVFYGFVVLSYSSLTVLWPHSGLLELYVCSVSLWLSRVFKWLPEVLDLCSIALLFAVFVPLSDQVVIVCGIVNPSGQPRICHNQKPKGKKQVKELLPPRCVMFYADFAGKHSFARAFFVGGTT